MDVTKTKPFSKKAYGHRLRQAMRAQGLDEFRLAAIVRRQKRTVDTWVAGERLPQRAEEIALADALNVSIDWLSGRSEALK